jgi:F-type H+-transporting ATPase subunit delta
MKTTKQLKREAKHLFRICLVNGLLDECRVRQAVKKVLDAKRHNGLALLAHFKHLVKLERSRHTAEVASAILLSPMFRANLLADLERVYGPGLATSFVLDPSLIGGMRIQVGSDVYDNSVRAELASLQRNF